MAKRKRRRKVNPWFKFRRLPKLYTSPFRRFIKHVSKLEVRRRAKTFAIIKVETQKKYEGRSKRGIIPFDMGLYTRTEAKRELTLETFLEQWELRSARLLKLSFKKLYGFWVLKRRSIRLKLATAKLKALFRRRELEKTKRDRRRRRARRRR